MSTLRKIVIIGGGFAGIKTALELARRHPPHTRIALVSDKRNFEYHATLYRVVTGHTPLESCVPLAQIFEGLPVDIIEDRITAVDLQAKTLRGNSGDSYSYDYLVLALGSETAYFNIPGLKERSYGMKSIAEALRLKQHLHETLSTSVMGTPEEKVSAAQVVIVGGGASGTELAGKLALYIKKLARNHKLDPSIVTIDLIEAAPRLLPSMPEKASEAMEKRLRSLGVNIFLNRAVMSEEVESVHMKDMELKTKTVVWTAGIKANQLISQIQGLELDKKGRVIVDAFMCAKGFENVFVAGDIAVTQYSGMAQTALRDGEYIAYRLNEILNGNKNKIVPYEPEKPWYVIPAGAGWAVATVGHLVVSGTLGWWIRRTADFFAFYSFLPIGKALGVLRQGHEQCETCPLCAEGEKHT